MEDEVEIDIVGEFNEKITPSSGSACEEMGFNINEFLPFLGSNSWLLSPEQVWNLETTSESKNKLIPETLLPEREMVIAQEFPKDKTESLTSHRKHWTQSEKEMFQRGLKMYGHSWTKISKFIGTRTTLQVKNFARQYLKQSEKPEIDSDQITLQMQEEELTSKSPPAIDHGYQQRWPDVQNTVRKDSSQITSDNSIKKSNNVSVSPSNDSKKYVKRKKFKVVHSKEIVRLNKENCSSGEEDIDIENLGDTTQQTDLSRNVTDSQSTFQNDNVLQIPYVEGSVTSEDSSKICEEDDIQLDKNFFPDDSNFNSLPSVSLEGMDTKNVISQSDDNFGPKEGSSDDNDDSDDGDVDRSYCSDQHNQKIFNFNIPEKELILERNAITDEERAFHVEFFEGRPQKTPERYLKIRNYILDSWEKCKPSYLNKTSVRPGLKNCGDVNCIGRIHMYLEQTGAINFGCDQTVYTRPITLSGRPLPSSKKNNGNQNLATQFARMETMRPRKRKIPVLTYDSEHGGYTITHGENGQIIGVAEGLDGPPPPLLPPPVSKRVRSGDNPFKLILCSEFSETNPAPFTLTVHIEAIAIMDVHAHLSHLEVIGLLGGHFDQENSLLHIVTAEPCESLSTGLECEMDPVSQTLASDKLQQEGYSVVGWYHSHPTFAPNPSIRDLETQAKFQGWFIQGGAPFLGVIISPHLPSSANSKLRYLIVGDEVVSPEGYRKPFKFLPTNFICDKSADEIVNILNGLLNRLKEGSESTKLSKTPLITMNKLLSSLHYHLTQFALDSSVVLIILNEFGNMLVNYLTAVVQPPSSKCLTG